jgi:hypothetical protein
MHKIPRFQQDLTNPIIASGKENQKMKMWGTVITDTNF